VVVAVPQKALWFVRNANFSVCIFMQPIQRQGPRDPFHIRAVRNGFPFDPKGEPRWSSVSQHSYMGNNPVRERPPIAALQ
jgi:hypothetical protein